MAASHAWIVLAGEIAAGGEDETRFDALLWNFTILGEAAAQVSDTLTRRPPRSDGKSRFGFAIASCMDLVHGYWSIDHDVLLVTATADVPAPLDQLTRLERSLET